MFYLFFFGCKVSKYESPVNICNFLQEFWLTYLHLNIHTLGCMIIKLYNT